jgi:acetolactate synthase-1/2/3 large subunit
MIRVSDYIANFLASHGISHCFMVTGGCALHLDDSLGHDARLTCLYQHHEQACAMAAEAYARVHNRMAAVCVTSGPGSTNAITGVMCAWLDSLPIFVLSGQVRYNLTARSTGLPLRAVGDQEIDICRSIKPLTKYCAMVTDPYSIRYHLEKAFYLAVQGRPGPVWLDIPLDVQGAFIDEAALIGSSPFADEDAAIFQTPPPVSDSAAAEILDSIRQASRPVFYAGQGIRISGTYDTFLRVIRKLNIPVVTGWDTVDLLPDSHPLYAGRPGIMGDRPGNWAVQSSDLLFCVGSRLNIRQIGFQSEEWAPQARTIVCDIDPFELKKPTIHADLPLWADAADLLARLDASLPEGEKCFSDEGWIAHCQKNRRDYPVVQPRHYLPLPDGKVNVYAFMKELSSRLGPDEITVVESGAPCIAGSPAYIIREGHRFLCNAGSCSMGYGLPAAIGAWAASGGQTIISLNGDGSIQMNLQELQTILHYHMDIRIFVINNEGYHAIRQSERNLFAGRPLVGIGPDSGDLSFPDLCAVASAYGYPTLRIHTPRELIPGIKKVLSQKGPFFCEIMTSPLQDYEPKSATKQLPDGSLISAPLQDLAPFLPEEEIRKRTTYPSP